jgi:hypothetical protein
VQLTGGTITVNADLAKAPFTSDFLAAVAPNGASPSSHRSKTIDIGQKVKQTGKPVRIATQKVDGKWYPSLLYTIADNAVTSQGLQAPSAADRIPAVGASSADEAVESFLNAILNADLPRVGQLLSPDELAVVHDYGKLILDRLHYRATGVKIRSISFDDTKNSDGTRVNVSAIEIALPNGQIFKAAISGDCMTVTVQGQTQHFCAAQLATQLSGLFHASLTPAQQTALADLFGGLTKAVGLETSQSGGRWYVNPLRSYFNIFNEMLSGLKGDDGKQLLQLLGHH